MEAVESLADPAPFDWRDRQIKTGWDLCVLALGSGGAIFTLPEVQKMLGTTITIDAGIFTLLITVGLGVGVAAIRKRPKERQSGWMGMLALTLGGTALVIPWYIVVRS